MINQESPFGQDRAPLRLQLDASNDLREALSLLIKPGLRDKFGQTVLRAVAREVLVDISYPGNQFMPEQEREIGQYDRAIENLKTHKFPVQPVVQFKQDERHNLHVGLWPVVSLEERQKIIRPPFYELDDRAANLDDRAAIGATIRLSEREVLPDNMLRSAMMDVESAFGARHPAALAAGRAANRLYLDNLSVNRVPLVVRRYPSVSEH